MTAVSIFLMMMAGANLVLFNHHHEPWNGIAVIAIIITLIVMAHQNKKEKG